ncbi:MFS transporter [Embleya sp. NPDC059259]|uniref:MFS transporter n=1 Tax=unclassified Embleya TaxID=2699296 RepID=UPI0036A2FF42
MRHGGGALGLVAPATSWGLFWGGWAALIPTIKDELSLDDRQLGLALFAVPVAAVPAMLLTGPLARRLGPRTLPLVTAAFAGGILAVAAAGSRWTFAAALLLIGAASGAIEVALNATTAAREALTGERLFNKVQAATPLAMVLAAPAVGLALHLGASARAILVTIAVLVALSAIPAIDRRRWQEQEDPEPAAHTDRAHGRLLVGLLVVGAVGGTVLLMENTVEQWGAIHLADGLGAGSFLAACGPAAYMAGLSAGRLLAQWRGERVGDQALVLVGGVLGGLGLALAAAAWSTASTLAGFALAGVGLAPVVPTLLAATGRAVAPERRAQAISLVTTVSYAGFLGAPPLVGTLAGQLGLGTVLGLVALCGAVVVAAGSRSLRLLPAEETGDPAPKGGTDPSTDPPGRADRAADHAGAGERGSASASDEPPGSSGSHRPGRPNRPHPKGVSR